MKHFVTACSLAAFMVPGLAHAAATVYPGCAVPVAKAGRHTFWVDPVKGSKSGDGSAAKPWRTLADVLDRSTSLVATQGHDTKTFAKGNTALVAVNPKGVIKPGDVIMLMSGNHGSFVIQNNFNSDFITVMAAPGQTPVIEKMSLVSSSKWFFQGVKFQGRQPDGAKGVTQLASVGTGDWLGSSHDVVFDNDSFSAADDSGSWTSEQWNTIPYNYSLYFAPATSCLSVTNSHFFNVMNAIGLASDNSVVQGNLIEKMANDGVDMLASNLIVKGNTFKNGENNLSSALHADAIQGWSRTVQGVVLTNKNVLVDSNTIIKTGDGSASYLQGISVFNGLWNNLTISNNMVVTNTYNGISVAGANNATIINNTVVPTDPKYGTWIQVTKAKGAPNPTNVVLRNNIANTLNVNVTGIAMDHNIVSSNMAVLDTSGKINRISSGSYGNKNQVISSIMSQFVTNNNNSATYDLRPRTGSPAIAAGIADRAPAIDIVGKARKPSVTIGAYN